MTSEAAKPYDVFLDNEQEPLNNGFVYIGTAGTNPELTANQLSVYWDLALSIDAAQPLRTQNGYIVRGGSPGRVYIAEADYSMTVRDRNGNLIFTNLNNALTDQSAAIAANTAAIAVNAADIATNAADIATNAADIATNAADITTNAADIATNTADIATNTADIATNTAAIAALDTFAIDGPTAGSTFLVWKGSNAADTTEYSSTTISFATIGFEMPAIRKAGVVRVSAELRVDSVSWSSELRILVNGSTDSTLSTSSTSYTTLTSDVTVANADQLTFQLRTTGPPIAAYAKTIRLYSGTDALVVY